MAARSQSRLGLFTALAVGVVSSIWVAIFAAIGFGIRDGWLLNVWNTIDDGQAQVASSAIAALGLLTSAVLVPFIFKDRIRDLDGAVTEMKGTIQNFENDAAKRLGALTTLLEEKMKEVEDRTSTDADRIGNVLEEIRAAVILSVSDGQISDPKHAKVFAHHLFNDAVAALQRRVRVRRLRETTRAHIGTLRTMSPQYLNKLEESDIISADERAIVDRIKKLAYRQLEFSVSEVPDINRARADFDRAFGGDASTTEES